MDEQALEVAINNLRTRIEQLTAQIGTSMPGTAKKSQVPGSKTDGVTALNQAAAASAKQLEAIRNKQKLNIALTDEENELLKASAREIKKETDARKESDKYLQKSFKNFGKSLLSDSSSLQSSISSLSGSLEYTDSKLGKVLSGVAGGIGFMLGGLEKFAESAADMGAFADLSTFSVGAVRSMKVMSGVGNSFTKVIEESQGQFRMYGNTSEQAAKNLSNLSRAFKLGGGYVNSTLRDSLGKDLVDGLDKASTAAAAMGLTDEQRAKLTGQLARTAALGAKNEQDAQKRLVSQYTETILNTRKLSNTLGESAATILEAMAAFRKSSAGTFASLEGNTTAQFLAGTFKNVFKGLSEEQVANMSLALSRGDVGQAQYIIGQDTPQAQGYQRMLAEILPTLQSSGYGADQEAFNNALKNSADRFIQVGKEVSGMAPVLGGYEKPFAELAELGTKLKLAPGAEETETTGTSEADNIKSMGKLTDALNSLRNVIIGITAGIATLGTAVTLVAGGLGGGLLAGGTLKGALGKVKDMFSNFKSANQGPKLPGSDKGGLFERLFGGMSADKASEKVSGVMDTVKGKVKSLGEVISDVGKGIGNFAKAVGKGVGGAIAGIMTGVAKGIEAFGNPAVLKGALILSGSIAIIGAGFAAATWLIGKSLGTFAENLKSLAEVNGSALMLIGAGLAAIGAGATVFAAGMIIGTSSSVVTGLMSLFGAKSPLERVKEFVPIADKISLIGTGIKDFGTGLATISDNLTNLDLDKFAKFKDILIELSEVDMPSIDGIAPPTISTAISENIPPGGALQTALANGSITPEMIGQLFGYLSSIQNDLEAIRGNTRGSLYDTPVKLA